MMRLRKMVLNIYSTHLCNWLSCSLETLYLRRGGGSPTLGLVNDDHDDCDDCYYDMNYLQCPPYYTLGLGIIILTDNEDLEGYDDEDKCSNLRRT